MLLAINTCLRSVELALIDEVKGVIVKEVSISSERSHAELIFEYLEKFGIVENKPDKVVVVCGPGPFTSIRVGVVVANSIAFGAGASVCGIDLNTLFEVEARYGGPGKIFVSAGKSEVYELQPLNEEGLKKGRIYTDHFVKHDAEDFFEAVSEPFYGNLSPVHLEMLEGRPLLRERSRTLGEIILELYAGNELAHFEAPMAAPIYLKPPNISVSKKKI